MNAGTLLLLGTLAAGGRTAPGPMPVPAMGPPVAAIPAPPDALLIPAPLLAARVIAPQGVRVAVYPASPFGRINDTPTLLGLRPGYVYRLELSNLPYNPG